MCGIFAIHNYEGESSLRRTKCLALSKKLRHRGPDWSGCYENGNSILCHERLAVVGVDTGAQPIVNDEGTLALCVNGEIYNYKTLKRSLQDCSFKTHSDCEVIMHLYKKCDLPSLCNQLDGMFSFVLLDSLDPQNSRMVAARDPIGITTLYMGSYNSTYCFASEMKGLPSECTKIISFPPGCFWDSRTGEIQRYYEPAWFKVPTQIPTTPVDFALLRTSLEKAVRKRLMSEVPYGVLLSGGLDSSLIAAIAARETEKVARAQMQREYLKRASNEDLSQSVSSLDRMDVGDSDEEDDSSLTSWPRLHSFSIGLPGAPDLLAARQAASYLGTVHHEYTFTVQEGIDALQDVIYHLETFDVTTVRASTPMYLLSRKIKASGVKMVLSGEGSDEIFGGYLYFHKAPTGKDFHQECVDRVKNLHTADCLRANKSTMAWGLEARVPFLDKEFLSVSMDIRPDEKMFGSKEVDAQGRPKMEKYILRKAFDISPGGRPYLPDSILWRQKEQFSDGVGYSWIDGMKEHASKVVTDEQLSSAKDRWPLATPDTKEAYMIREMFESHFPGETAAGTAVRWVPRTDWGCSSDPSGRAQAVHEKAY
ncbi:glutamine-hydrolyzing asparagine synthase [Atractiella rhizophila]|nr:glutamine-hydrolyzing asparagine synthase [Atractiella rhizophila]